MSADLVPTPTTSSWCQSVFTFHLNLTVLTYLARKKKSKIIERKNRGSHLGGSISVANYRQGGCNPSVSSAPYTEITQSTFQSKYSLRVNIGAHFTRPDYHFFKGTECSIVSGRQTKSHAKTKRTVNTHSC